MPKQDTLSSLVQETKPLVQALTEILTRFDVVLEEGGVEISEEDEAGLQEVRDGLEVIFDEIDDLATDVHDRAHNRDAVDHDDEE
jgi:hypothetical protein